MIKPMKFYGVELLVILTAIKNTRGTFAEMEKGTAGRVSLVAWDTIAERLEVMIQKQFAARPGRVARVSKKGGAR